ncbi:MAG TPA: 30S ribosomal protein S7 [Bacillota bacterium]|nr:30S ribosomal protein S7 [Bacillota bacterium]
MPRKGHVPKREVLPDPVYGDIRVAKLINNVMLDGKKELAQTIVYAAFDLMEDRVGQPPLEVFNQAMENVMPVLEVKARRVGGSNYQVPMEVRPERRQTLALRWIVQAARSRSERTMKERLANELIDASKQSGSAFRRKEEIHRMAEANRAFAHYRW